MGFVLFVCFNPCIHWCFYSVFWVSVLNSALSSFITAFVFCTVSYWSTAVPPRHLKWVTGIKVTHTHTFPKLSKLGVSCVTCLELIKVQSFPPISSTSNKQHTKACISVFNKDLPLTCALNSQLNPKANINTLLKFWKVIFFFLKKMISDLLKANSWWEGNIMAIPT